MAESAVATARSSAPRPAGVLATSGPMSEDRRKRAFRRLVSDVAENFDDNNKRHLHWQAQLPPQLKDKSSLDILEHLHKHGFFTEYEVRPLVQLLKDIHRQDLITRVDAFSEEFIGEQITVEPLCEGHLGPANIVLINREVSTSQRVR